MLWGIVSAARIVKEVCWELGMAMLGLYLQLCWNFMVWVIAIITLPLRLVTALYAHIKLEEQIDGMKKQLEDLANENNELEEYLLLASKERQVLEEVFQEMEEDQKKMLREIDLLHDEIKHLKAENLGLRQAQGKDLWDWRTSNLKEGRVILQDILIQGDRWGDDEKRRRPSPSKETISEEDETCQLVRKIVAIRQSLFSTFLSLVVGLIIWEAEDPCFPLVAALFAVIGMSIGSVVQFFFSVKNKPASDAVALLSINCFMLGTLTCPTLPRVATFCAPWPTRALDWLLQ